MILLLRGHEMKTSKNTMEMYDARLFATADYFSILSRHRYFRRELSASLEELRWARRVGEACR